MCGYFKFIIYRTILLFITLLILHLNIDLNYAYFYIYLDVFIPEKSHLNAKLVAKPIDRNTGNYSIYTEILGFRAIFPLNLQIIHRQLYKYVNTCIQKWIATFFASIFDFYVPIQQQLLCISGIYNAKELNKCSLYVP